MKRNSPPKINEGKKERSVSPPRSINLENINLVPLGNDFEDFLNLPPEIQNLILQQLRETDIVQLLSTSKYVSHRISENASRIPSVNFLSALKKLESQIKEYLGLNDKESASNVIKEFVIQYYSVIKRNDQIRKKLSKLASKISPEIDEIMTGRRLNHGLISYVNEVYENLSEKGRDDLEKELVGTIFNMEPFIKDVLAHFSPNEAAKTSLRKLFNKLLTVLAMRDNMNTRLIRIAVQYYLDHYKL